MKPYEATKLLTWGHFIYYWPSARIGLATSVKKISHILSFRISIRGTDKELGSQDSSVCCLVTS